MANKRVKATEESATGRNKKFHDNYNGQDMTRSQFVKQIKNNDNNYQDKFYIRNINGIDTPCSNPDDSENNNLG